ncbi:MAG: hypothetical protein NZM41_06835 [Saprospiraceae bacterium]|nr:hypothetical protein [Saprospiraceae bacterium]
MQPFLAGFFDEKTQKEVRTGQTDLADTLPNKFGGYFAKQVWRLRGAAKRVNCGPKTRARGVLRPHSF